MPKPVALLSLGSLPDSAMGRGARKVTPIFAVNPVQWSGQRKTRMKTSQDLRLKADYTGIHRDSRGSSLKD